MKLVNRPMRPVGREQDWLADAVRYGGVPGEVLVTSVHVLVYSRAGERIFEGRGGFNFVEVE